MNNANPDPNTNEDFLKKSPEELKAIFTNMFPNKKFLLICVEDTNLDTKPDNSKEITLFSINTMQDKSSITQLAMLLSKESDLNKTLTLGLELSKFLVTDPKASEAMKDVTFKSHELHDKNS